MKAQDGQDDFTGGMNNRVAPERLKANEFSLGKNIEIRHGGESRRGSWSVDSDLYDSNFDSMPVTGTGILKKVEHGESDVIITSVYRPEDDRTLFYRTRFPTKDHRKTMEIPETLSGNQSVRFVQAYNYMYAIRDGEQPWRWNGDIESAWETVPAGVSGPMPYGRDGYYAYNRLWLIEGDDTLIPSDSLDANWDRSSNDFRVEQGDGTKLVALRQFGNGGLIAFKERGIALISGANNFTDSGDLALQFIDDKVGCVAPDTVVSIGKDVFFLGREGVWTINQTSEQNAQLVEIPLSNSIYGLIQEINWQYSDRFFAEKFDNYYLCGVSVGGSEYPNRILVYDLESRSWAGYWEYGSSATAFSDISTISHLGKNYLFGQTQHGGTNVLLVGDTEDFKGSNKKYQVYGVTEVPFDTLDFSEFTDGRIDMTLLFNGGTWPFIQRPQFGGGAGANTITAGFTSSGYDINGLYFTIYASGATQWYGSISIANLNDGKFHSLSLIHDGVQPHIELDGERMELSFSAGSIDRTVWLDQVNAPTGFGYNNASPTYRSANMAKVRISTEYKTAAPHTTELEMWIASYSPSEEGSAYTVVDGVGTKTSFNSSDLSYNPSPSEVVSYGSYSGGGYDIESILKTKGYLFGDIMSQKSNLVGELRFTHGQPSITMQRLSDMPFDSEVLSSLDGKVYSLTEYETAQKAAWDNTNANNDFATPGREDYAPVGMGLLIGDDGFSIDIYREHTELFTSLAVFGWSQFTLTNTQGYVRYNALMLEAVTKKRLQDTGNNQ